MEKAIRNELLESVSKRLVELRKKQNMSQTDIARKLHITRSVPEHWEMGRALPSIPLLIDISKMYHVSVDYILGISNKKSEYIILDKYTEEERNILYSMIDYFDSKHTEEE